MRRRELLQGQVGLQERQQCLQGSELLQRPGFPGDDAGEVRRCEGKGRQVSAVARAPVRAGRVLLQTPMSRLEPPLGFGLGLRVDHYEAILAGPPAGRLVRGAHRELSGARRQAAGLPARIRERYPLVLHGVSLSIGSTEPLDRDYLGQLRQLAAARRAALDLRSSVLDRHRPVAIMHDLLPLPYTEEALRSRRGARAHGAGRARAAHAARERLELRQLPGLRAHRMGIPAGDRRARRLPAAARCQQHLCEQRQS